MREPMKRICLLCAAFTISIAGCSGSQPKISATINQNASLVGALPANPLQWKVITSELNKSDSTMSTLYGNDIAVQYARTNSQHNYPKGAVLSLVTWNQSADERYFGAKIPDQAKSVEFIFVETGQDGHPSYSYQKYEGHPLKKREGSQDQATSERTTYLLSQRAAVMP